MNELEMIYCNNCEMPVEFCECEDPKFRYDWESDIFVLVGDDDD